jgi:WD40 repeat protein
MFGRMLIGGGVAGVMLAGLGWFSGLHHTAAQSANPADKPAAEPTLVAQAPTTSVAVARALYSPAQVETTPVAINRPTERRNGFSSPIVIANSRLALPPASKVDVPAQREGVLQFLGVEVKKGETPPADAYEVYVGSDRKQKKMFRPIHEGDYIHAEELIGRVDDTILRAELKSKEAKVTAAVADKDSSEKTRDETLQRYNTQVKLFNVGNLPATSAEELRGAWLTYIRYKYEADSKKEAITVAQAERDQAAKTLDMCDMKCKISGVVKTFYRHKGEWVKNLEPQVLQIQNYDTLRAEGMVDKQYLNHLHPGDPVVIEATQSDNPDQTFPGHRQEVTAVAVSKDQQNPLIFTASEDGTVFVWDWKTRQAKGRLVPSESLSPVVTRAIACTAPGSQTNLCLTGGSDGVGRIWDLDRFGDKPRELKGNHQGGIRCVAFSPDGNTCATGGEDQKIVIWDTRTGERRYTLEGHRNWVTTVVFTPQSELVSAGQDDRIRVWKLGETSGQELPDKWLVRQSHNINQVGVSPDGKRILDEHAREMRILSLDTQMTDGGMLQNTSQSGVFSTFSLFSPDGQLALTTSGSDGVLQLWRLNPLRNYEVMHLVSGEHVPAKCAAFAPDGSFVVAGVENGKVCIWPIPSKDELERQIPARITTVEQTIENVEGKVRILAEFTNPKNRPLRSGDFVTIVAYPRKS